LPCVGPPVRTHTGTHRHTHTHTHTHKYVTQMLRVRRRAGPQGGRDILERDSITGSPGRQGPSTLTACGCQDEESASDDFMEPNNRTDGSQALEWDIDTHIEGMSAETDDFQ
jgi:hypothetical protein